MGLRKHSSKFGSFLNLSPRFQTLCLLRPLHTTEFMNEGLLEKKKKLILCWLWEKKITITHSSKLKLSQLSKTFRWQILHMFFAVLVDKMTFTYNINVESISYIEWVDSSIQEKFVFNEVRLNRLYFDKSLFSWQGRIHKNPSGHCWHSS